VLGPASPQTKNKKQDCAGEAGARTRRAESLKMVIVPIR